MFLEIPKIRPAVLPADLRGFLNDLRGFRHAFRHTYEFELDVEKVALLVRNWNKARRRCSPHCHDSGTTFCGKSDQCRREDYRATSLAFEFQAYLYFMPKIPAHW